MKKVFIILIFSIFCNDLFSQKWISVNRTLPDYAFELPETPNFMDTLNVRLAWLKYDSLTVFQVLEFKDTPLDTANTAFNIALEQTSGDTLLAIAQSIATTNNFPILNSQNITSFSEYKGLEVSMSSYDAATGKMLRVYTRFYYNIHTLLTFSITGLEDDIVKLQKNKNLFFDSISL
jgi:hypothetical protein